MRYKPLNLGLVRSNLEQEAGVDISTRAYSEDGAPLWSIYAQSIRSSHFLHADMGQVVLGQRIITYNLLCTSNRDGLDTQMEFLIMHTRLP